MRTALRSLLVQAFLLLYSTEWAVGSTPLYFSLIASFGRDGFNSSGVVPAVDYALEQINSNASSLLPGYTLRRTETQDSECNRVGSLDAFFREIQSEPVKISLLGCGCSVATEPVAEISHHWNISQISFASATSSLSDRTRFRKYFRTFPTFENLAPALLSILEHFGWKRIAFLTQDENLFNNLYMDFQALLDNLASNTTEVCCFNVTNITALTRRFQTKEDPIPVINDLFDYDGSFRVFYLNSYSAFARPIICEAARRNLTYPRYAWIQYGWYPERWWTAEISNQSVPCSDTELENFLGRSRMLIFHEYGVPDDLDGVAVSGIMHSEFSNEYMNRITSQEYLPTIAGSLAYDAVWTLALGLNRTLDMIERGDIDETGCEEKGLEGDIVSLHEFNYTNGLMGCVMRWSLEQTNFKGVSGHVKFDVNGTIIQDQIRLLQYRRDINNTLKRVRYGNIEINNDFKLIYTDSESDQSVFPDGIPPDGTPVKVIHNIHIGLTIVYYTLAAIGILFAVGCTLFNFAYKNRKSIRLTSPNLNYFISIGAFLMYASVFIGSLHTTRQNIVRIQCILHTWIYLIGYLFAFGTILAKMWRVYHIFHNPTPNKMKMKDWHLILIVLLVTGIGVILITVKTATQLEPPLLVQDKEISEGRTQLGVLEEYCVWICYKSDTGPFYCDILIFAYIALLQIVGVMVAFQTRKVKVSMLNDSKFVAALVYISSIVLVLLALVTFAFGGYKNVVAGIFCGGILVLATVFLILMFIPKMVTLYRDPQGEKIFEKSNSRITSSTTTTAENKDSVTLQKMIKKQEQKISELEQELAFFKNGVSDEMNNPTE